MSSAELAELKRAVKEAIGEAMRENSDVFKEIVAEVLEDMAMLQRMEEGRNTELVDRQEIMDLLEPKR
jgi:hypothetical protein